MKICKKKYFEYDSCISPHQQPADEIDAPKDLVAISGLTSDGKSIPRELRPERGYGKLKFKKDLSKCYLYIFIENIKSDNINLIHIHAGPPNFLGPVLVNITNLINIKKDLAKGYVKITLRNKDVNKFELGEAAAICSCNDTSNCSCDKYNSILPKIITINGLPLIAGTIASLDLLARQGLLYFNFHNN